VHSGGEEIYTDEELESIQEELNEEYYCPEEEYSLWRISG
jgi:hypothetical protein